jgi:hypothetical protein
LLFEQISYNPHPNSLSTLTQFSLNPHPNPLPQGEGIVMTSGWQYDLSGIYDLSDTTEQTTLERTTFIKTEYSDVV